MSIPQGQPEKTPSTSPLSEDGAIKIRDHVFHDQVKVLNNAFEPHFAFDLNNITRIVEANWAGGRDQGQMRNTQHRGDHKTLNLYFVDWIGDPTDTSLGECNYPEELVDNPKGDGCILRTTTLPGSSDNVTYFGTLAVHEIGHFLGLRHTYQGGCTEGDFVADTPPMADRTNGSICLSEKLQHSCGDSRPAPLENFMASSSDFCANNFTPGQFQRMRRWWKAYRASATLSPPDRKTTKGRVTNACLLYATSDEKCGEFIKNCSNTVGADETEQETIQSAQNYVDCVTNAAKDDNNALSRDSPPPEPARFDTSLQKAKCESSNGLSTKGCLRAAAFCLKSPIFKHIRKEELNDELFNRCLETIRFFMGIKKKGLSSTWSGKAIVWPEST
ncbi:hypothetical protein CDD83_8082 [Cordyceps sp. RAO-2017]|nr:hypothetical protein CDD83_8082 [Cordyceps sp. RAO-2017]